LLSTYRGIGTLTLQRRKIAFQEHEEIFNALKEIDTRRLNKILEKHISNSKRDAIERVKKETDMLYLGYHS
jgi:DNA-binding GntR family transcriptional regulator